MTTDVLLSGARTLPAMLLHQAKAFGSRPLLAVPAPSLAPASRAATGWR